MQDARFFVSEHARRTVLDFEVLYLCPGFIVWREGESEYADDQRRLRHFSETSIRCIKLLLVTRGSTTAQISLRDSAIYSHP